MGTLILFAALGSISYVLGLIIWPLRSCTLCHGAKRHRSPSGTHLRPCVKCGGSGVQTRVGAKIIGRMH